MILFDFNSVKYFRLTCYSIAVSIIFASAAVAEYKKPKTTSAPDSRTTTSTATRGGCSNKDNLDLTAIAPYSHVGQTVSTHPTFVWFVPDSEYFPLEFSLKEYTADSQLNTVYRQELDSKPGIMSLSLPQNLPDLSVGKKYRWKVVMRCTRYKAVVTMAEIEVVAPTPELSTASSNSDVNRLVDVYSSNGLWYNALETINAADSSQTLQELIQQLAAVETKSNSTWAQQQGQKLNYISDRLKSDTTVER